MRIAELAFVTSTGPHSLVSRPDTGRNTADGDRRAPQGHLPDPT